MIFTYHPDIYIVGFRLHPRVSVESSLPSLPRRRHTSCAMAGLRSGRLFELLSGALSPRARAGHTALFFAGSAREPFTDGVDLAGSAARLISGAVAKMAAPAARHGPVDAVAKHGTGLPPAAAAAADASWRGAVARLPAVLSSSGDLSRKHLTGSPTILLALSTGSLASSSQILDVALSSCPCIFAGLAAGAAVGCLGVCSLCVVSEYWFGDVAADPLDMGDVQGMVYCNGKKSIDKATDSNGGGSGRPGSPSPPRRPSGLSDLEKKTFLQLLLKLQHNLRRLLDAKDYEDVKDDIEKKNQMFVVVVRDVEETRLLVQALLKEMQERSQHHVVVALLQKILADLEAFQKKLLEKEDTSKPWAVKQLEELIGGKETGLLLQILSFARGSLDFVVGKWLIALGLTACISAKLTPGEAFCIGVQHIEEAKKAQDEKVEGLQEKARQRLKEEDEKKKERQAPGPK